MLKFKNKLIIAVMLMIGITAFMSCEKGEPISTQENQSIEEYNKNILDVLKLEFDQLNCLKSTGFNLIETLETDEGKALFSDYCINLKIEIEGNEYIINDYDPSLVDELYESTLVKLSHFDDVGLKSAQSLKEALTDEEIREAMLKECGTYTEPLGGICKGAVWIAYWLR